MSVMSCVRAWWGDPQNPLEPANNQWALNVALEKLVEAGLELSAFSTCGRRADSGRVVSSLCRL